VTQRKNDALSDHERKYRRWYRFSLRSLFVLAFLVAVGTGWFAAKWREATRRVQAVAALLNAGATVESKDDVDSSEWLRQILGESFFKRVYRVTFFHQNDVTDDDLRYVADLPELEELTIINGRISDDGLTNLSELANLRWLRLEGVFITDAGVEHLLPLANIESLDLSGAKVTDASLPRLRAFPKLRILELENTPVSDNGMAALSTLDSVEVLALAVTNITDAGIEPLCVMKQLKFLRIGGTRITQTGVDRLQAALPDCQITWWLRVE
jgi:hypothetical protein